MEIRKAYIYSRVSKGTQTKGDGLRRQVESATKFVEMENASNRSSGRHTYVVEDNLITDRGLSAYKGLNTEANAGLGAFIEAAKNGDIVRGSLLVVEAIDRCG